jgi:L-fuconolactonase
MRVDSHHHLWRFAPDEYTWIADDMAVLRRDYGIDDLEAVVRPAGIDGTIVVQARQSLVENDDLLVAAARCPTIAAVVGWVDLRDPRVADTLAGYAAHPRFRGVRHIVQAEPDGFLDDEHFNRGIARLKTFDLVYDLLIVARQLPEAIRFVDRHPDQPFVLDHLAKPTIRAAAFDSEWEASIRALARRPHVTCKVSGLVTEVRDVTWTVDVLRPYIDVVLDAFGPDRIMAGSDWPVCLLRSGYAEWQDALHRLFAPLSPGEQAAVYGETAARVYGLAGARP